MKFKFVDDLTSDVMFEAYGKTESEVFANAALAMFDVVCGAGKGNIGTSEKIEVTLSANSLENLLYDWLSHLLTESDIRNLFLGKFECEVTGKAAVFSLRATAYGEPAVVGKGGTAVKAVTYYGLKVERTEKGYKVRASLDI